MVHDHTVPLVGRATTSIAILEHIGHDSIEGKTCAEQSLHSDPRNTTGSTDTKSAGSTTLMFIWSVFFKNLVHPYSLIFTKVIKPRLKPPVELEDPRGPMFAQKIGLTVSLLAFSISIISPIWGSVFAAMLFLASALNAYLNICLGCIMYLRLRKLGINL